MGMVVQHNMNALTAYNKLNANVAGLKKSSEKLASGYRINRAGDDAAGLAISEKMRSQIKGLNQAIRNSQDGINMVQTFEGAAQETHSILQRMKELATESANGTYDNPTDRAAIQLEFDQLNDELNQIADTDFNGTVVLNGGVMADGTVAKNGEFDYANGYTETVVAAKANDLSADQAHTMADQSFYTKEIADAVYGAVKVDVAADTANAKIGVTFMYDGERWVSDTVTNSDGEVIEGARAAGLEARPVDRTDASGKGGFQVIAGKDPYTGKDIVATNVIFDEMVGPVKKGDTVTVYFENSAAKTYAPKNAGLDECYDGTNKAFKIDDETKVSQEDMVDRVKFELDKGITDAAMNPKLNEALTALDNTEFKITFADGVATWTAAGAEAKNANKDAVTAAGATITDIKIAADGTVTYGADAATAITLGKLSVENITKHQNAKAATTSGMEFKSAAGADKAGLTLADPEKFAKLLESKGVISTAEGKSGELDSTTTKDLNATVAANGDITFAANQGDNAANVTITLADLKANGLEVADGTTFLATDTFKITYTPGLTDKEVKDDTKDAEVTFSVNVDAFNFADMKALSVHTDATPKVATMASQVATPGVTQANAFKNSTARMTYTDNITLQTGARTKDAVNFNFSYNTDGSADMGDLLPNLDLSARSTGLNTANLSLASQDDANYAIDQIDKAINKTSMVRATFGSIQNRLEHKITNLTTTAENLTEAESSIRDTDMANEMMNYTKFNILQQAAQSMLAQANQQPQSILQLLG